MGRNNILILDWFLQLWANTFIHSSHTKVIRTF